MSELLECTINSSGNPFKVTEKVKDNTFPPKSRGFTSFIMGPENNNPNIVYRKVIITRRGKKGKERLDQNVVKTPIFRTPKFIDKLKNEENLKEDNLIDIETNKHSSDSVFKFSDLVEVDLNFLGWALSKGLFIAELDKVVYPADHEVIKKLGIDPGNAGKKKFWEKTSIFKRFITNIEGYYVDGLDEEIHSEFMSPERRTNLLDYIRKAEMTLVIPWLEYRKRVNSVLEAALNYLESESETDKEVLKSIKNEKELVKKRNKNIEKTIQNKLNRIEANRNILNV